METGTAGPVLIDDEWVEKHFDHLSPDLARELHPTLARARSRCPVAHSDQHGGFWVVTRKEDVLRVAQDWKAFTSESGITVPSPPGPPMKILPVTVDPPLQREFRQLTNPYFRPTVVKEWEEPTRAVVNRLIDGFIEDGSCEFMEAFARPFPGLTFFDLALHAPAEDLDEVNGYAIMASQMHRPEARECLLKLAGWISRFVEERRREGPRGDVVDAVMAARIEGRPITPEEVVGTIQLLVLGGLETTAGVLGMAMLRLCEHPEILTALRERPELVPNAVEEFLRLDGSFVCIARTARNDTEVGGRLIRQGEKVLMYWVSANRDEAEFDNPDVFDLERARNAHVAFGAGPHRCAGSNLARMNLRVALVEIVRRLNDIQVRPGADIGFMSTFNRAPVSVPLVFTPGKRVSEPTSS
ncbi:cytochrome P450 [Parafrankia elaeagni]|uniref:cytochrome P450 n=1 Tax=Parafrankia elaeagni TaxID=222534 RepID=UPI00038185C2|nr:cytochrome P450 [Parafrankia elaeagni]